VVELSERLAALAPSGLGHVFYGSDGASAVEIALKMAFTIGATADDPENRFVSVAGSYHGETQGALGVTDVRIFRDVYAPLLKCNATVPSPDARAAAQDATAREIAERAADALDAYLVEHHASTAALIVEPLVQGAAGMVMHDPSYLLRVRELCTRHDVLLIADEIMTGFGRTGSLFAWEQADAPAPDFLCPVERHHGWLPALSAVLTSDAVFDAFYADDITRGFLHSHSYTGNALACRAALTVLDIFRDDDVIATNRVNAGRWTLLAAPLAANPKIHNFRHRE
jgi:adenosylmethionine-8-amino-7-oxononanoate aminotransferase